MPDHLPNASYWRQNAQIPPFLLAIRFVASFVLGILLVEQLNEYHLGGFPLGFWFAQQGSIYVFVVLIVIYAVWLGRLDRKYASTTPTDESDAGGPQ